MKKLVAVFVSTIMISSLAACTQNRNNTARMDTKHGVNEGFSANPNYQGTRTGYNFNQNNNGNQGTNRGTMMSTGNYADGVYTAYGDMTTTGNEVAIVNIKSGRIHDIILKRIDASGKDIAMDNTGTSNGIDNKGVKYPIGVNYTGSNNDNYNNAANAAQGANNNQGTVTYRNNNANNAGNTTGSNVGYDANNNTNNNATYNKTINNNTINNTANNAANYMKGNNAGYNIGNNTGTNTGTPYTGRDNTITTNPIAGGAFPGATSGGTTSGAAGGMGGGTTPEVTRNMGTGYNNNAAYNGTTNNTVTGTTTNTGTSSGMNMTLDQARVNLISAVMTAQGTNVDMTPYANNPIVANWRLAIDRALNNARR